MKREQILSILYDMALLTGGETESAALQTKMLQQFMLHTTFPFGAYVSIEGSSAQLDGSIHSVVEVVNGLPALSKLQGEALQIPFSFFENQSSFYNDEVLISKVLPICSEIRYLLVLPVPCTGAFLLFSGEAPTTDLPFTQIFQPILLNFAKALGSCKANEQHKRNLEFEKGYALQNLARFAGILDTASDAVISIDPKQCISLFNKAAESIFGYHEGEVLGKPLSMLLPLHARERHQVHVSDYICNDDHLRSRKMREQQDLVALRKNGEQFPIEAYLSKLDLGGELIMTVMLRDITRRKKIEQELLNHRDHLEDLVKARTVELEISRDAALAGTKAKSNFLANMSHELRTPLNSIIGFTGIVEQEMAGPLNAEQKKQLGMVYTSAQHLLELINDTLELSKAEAGKSKLIVRTIELLPLINEICELVEPAIAKKGLTFVCDSSEMPALFRTDRGKFKQVILNLLNNAVKFTMRGEIRLSLRNVAESLLEIKVQDSGIGIPSTKTGYIFEAFRQLDMQDIKMHTGTGLGLTICHNFVQLLGGSISVTSQVGKGSVFCVSLPVKKAVAASVAEY